MSGCQKLRDAMSSLLNEFLKGYKLKSHYFKIYSEIINLLLRLFNTAICACKFSKCFEYSLLFYSSVIGLVFHFLALLRVESFLFSYEFVPVLRSMLVLAFMMIASFILLLDLEYP